MLKVMLDFTRGIAMFPVHWRRRVAALFAANFIAPLFFLAGPEGRSVLGVGLAAAAIQMAIFARLGFVRLPETGILSGSR